MMMIIDDDNESKQVGMGGLGGGNGIKIPRG